MTWWQRVKESKDLVHMLNIYGEFYSEWVRADEEAKFLREPVECGDLERFIMESSVIKWDLKLERVSQGWVCGG